MSHQFLYKLGLNLRHVFILCLHESHAFKLLKIYHSFKTGLCYRQLLFLAFVSQKPKLLGTFTLSEEGKKTEGAIWSGGDSSELGR